MADKVLERWLPWANVTLLCGFSGANCMGELEFFGGNVEKGWVVYGYIYSNRCIKLKDILYIFFYIYIYIGNGKLGI